MSKQFKRITILFISVAMVGLLLIGCSSSSTAVKKGKTIVYSTQNDAKRFDPRDTGTFSAINIINQVFVGLVKLQAGPNGKREVAPAVAKSWTISPDKLTYTFHLRDDAKWSDGKQVVAGDFVYGWESALDPNFGSQNLDNLMPIKNALEYSKGKVKVGDVGIKALNNLTLQVTLKQPFPFFLDSLVYANFPPIRKDVAEKDAKGWTLNPATFIGDGPFKVSAYQPNNSMTLVPNPYYFDKANVKISKLIFQFVPEATTAYAGFLANTIDVMDTAPASVVQSMFKNGTAVAIPESGTSFININVGPKATAQVKKVLGNIDVRQALSLAINRVELCTDVLKGGQKPAVGFVPYGQVGPNGKEFRDHKTYFNAQGNVAQAQELLAKAGYPDGKGFPTFQYYYYTSEANDAIAQTIQDMWKKNLGINVTLVNREQQVFSQDMANGNYAIAMGGDTEVPEYPSILKENLGTKADYNVTGYSNLKFDAIIAKAQSEGDPQKSFDTYFQAEDIVMNDMPVIPLYYYNTLLIQQKNVTGVYRDNTSMIYFEKADKN